MEKRRPIALTKYAFEKISNIYDRLRRKPWLPILKIAEAAYRPPLLDAGCGTGRHTIPLLKKGDIIAVDIAFNMVKILNTKTRSKNLHAVVADLSYLPFRENSIGTVICIATLHHLPGRYRLKALKEFKRVLKPRGMAIITVWSILQRGFIFRALKQYVLSKLRFTKTSLSFGDLYVTWKTSQGPVYRFYHLYFPGELEKEVKKAGFQIKSSFVYNPHKKLFENFGVIAIKID